MSVLLSIKPEFADRIFTGEKKFEFRRALPAEDVERVVIYVSSPVQRILGEFMVGRVLSMSPSALWRQTRDHAGITRAYFNQYFAGRPLAHALEVGRVVRYRQPIDPWQSVDDFTAPQSFMYLRTLERRGLAVPVAA